MRIPLSPPQFPQLLQEIMQAAPGQEVLDAVFGGQVGPEPGGKYRHWDNLRHWQNDDGLTPEQR